MTGKERIRKAFSFEETDRIPWVPFVGVHGGYLTGENAENYLKSSKCIVNGVSKAIELYKPDGIPVCFDLQAEAEALGCRLKWAADNPPAVVSHPLEGNMDTGLLPEFTKEAGRIPVFMEASRVLRKKHPGIALYGLITGPFTLALHLAGTNIFMQMMESPDEVIELMEYCKDITKKMASWYIREGCDVIAVVDPMTSQIDPVSFESFVSPPAIELFEHIRQEEALGSFFVCGFAQQNIEAMCRCKPDNISIDENIPLSYVKEIAKELKVSFGGNLKLTSVLSMGSVRDVELHTLETVEQGGDSGFILAPGCDLVMDTPADNLIAVGRVVSDTYHREFLKTLDSAGSSIEASDLSGYWKDDKLIIDIITLDSSSCAPCQYMVEAVKLAAEKYGDLAICNEYSIKTRDGISMMKALGVKNVPVTVMDGEVRFISQIPPSSQIDSAIREKLAAKNLL